MIAHIQCWPDATLISSTKEDEEPECGHDKAEDGHKHDPAQRVWWVHARRGHQDPHQATTDKLWEEEDVRKGGEDSAAHGHYIH